MISTEGLSQVFEKHYLQYISKEKKDSILFCQRRKISYDKEKRRTYKKQ